AARFNDNQWARLRPKLIATFYATVALAAIASIFVFKDPAWRIGVAGGLVGFAILWTLLHQLLAGITGRTFLLRKVRQLIWSAGPIEWLKWTIALVVGGYLLHVFGLLGSWIGFGVLAAGVAIGFHFSIDLLRNRERDAAVQQVQALI